jgi:hypothetical protein
MIKVSLLRHLPTLYHTKGPNDVEPLATIRDKLSRPKLSLPQVPLSHTTLIVAKQHQPSWSAASRQATTKRQPKTIIKKAVSAT